MNVEQYLQRINIHRIEKPSYTYLATLQYQHLLAVPFENLDISEGREIILDEHHIYEKIVVSRRGGFCYELNGLFCWLLRQLKFSTHMVSARVYEERNNDFGPEFDHMVLLVRLDKTYLADVGFGDSFRYPMAIPDGQAEDVSGRYRVHKAGNRDEYLIQKLERDNWQPKYSFTAYPRKIADFTEMCILQQTSPESHFKQGPFATVATERGRVTLSRNSLTITEGRETRKTPVISPQQFGKLLYEHFNVKL
jgi:N-hydroxyarylamine O-acetyltransferase